MRIPTVAFSLMLFLASPGVFAQTVHDMVLKGKSCSEQQRNQQIDCDYKIGNDFWLSIAAVGQTIATVHFMKSDFNGKYYGSYGGLHGCVMVDRGKLNRSGDLFDVAFVSPKNGKVYRDWTACRDGF